MIRSFGSGDGRRGRGLGRPFFYLLASLSPLLGAATSARVYAPPDQPHTSAASTASVDSIAERQIRITLASNGDYRVIEIHSLEPDTVNAGSEVSGPLRLIQVPPAAFEVTGLGGDIEPSRVVHSPPYVHIVGPLPAPGFRLALSYRLAPDVDEIVLQAELPVRDLRLLIDRGTIKADPDDALHPEGEGGSAQRPVAIYSARELAAGEKLVVRVGFDHPVGWRQRIAVLAAAGLACVVAALVAWRRDRDRNPAIRRAVAGSDRRV